MIELLESEGNSAEKFLPARKGILKSGQVVIIDLVELDRKTLSVLLWRLKYYVRHFGEQYLKYFFEPANSLLNNAGSLSLMLLLGRSIFTRLVLS
jgi:hypothetical protein